MFSECRVNGMEGGTPLLHMVQGVYAGPPDFSVILQIRRVHIT